jgi:hypothetical protein
MNQEMDVKKAAKAAAESLSNHKGLINGFIGQKVILIYAGFFRYMLFY